MNGLTGRIALLAVLICLAAPAVILADVKSDLLKRGVRVSTTAAALNAESEVASQLKEVSTFRRKLLQASSQLKDHKKEDALDTQIARLNQQLVGLNAQMANVQDVVTNNRLVGAIGATEGQLRLAYESREQRTKQEAGLHEQLSVARDGMVAHLAEMRKTADDVARQYYNADQETLDLIAQLNKENGSTIALAPSSSFLSNLRRLEELEGDILSEDIKLRRDGNTYWASVKVNGESNLNMVVDSGAAIVLLCADDAAKAGVKVGQDAPQVRLGVADGRATTGRKVTIKTLQLGQFTADNVECVVLNPEAGRAAPLLGMTFLGRFKFQLDAGKSTLSLVKVRDALSASERPTRSTKLPAVQLIRNDWSLIPAAPDIPLWIDRDYRIKDVPEQLKNASLIFRKLDDPVWPAGEVIALQPADVLVAMRSDWTRAKMRIHDIDEDTLASLKSQGWKEIDGFSAAALPQQKWTWVLLQKRFDPGPIRIPALIPAEEPRVLIFIKPGA